MSNFTIEHFGAEEVKVYEYEKRFEVCKDESGMWGAKPMWSIVDNKYRNQATTIFRLKREAWEGVSDIMNDKSGDAYMSTFGRNREYYIEYRDVL